MGLIANHADDSNTHKDDDDESESSITHDYYQKVISVSIFHTFLLVTETLILLSLGLHYVGIF